MNKMVLICNIIKTRKFLVWTKIHDDYTCLWQEFQFTQFNDLNNYDTQEIKRSRVMIA